MKESIVTKLLSNAIRKFSNQFGGDTTPKQVQIIICTNDDSYGTPEYKLLHNYKTVRSLEFKDIYNGEDIFSFAEKAVLSLLPNIETTCSQFIANMMVDIGYKNNVKPSTVSIMIWSKDVQASQLMYHLYLTGEDGKKLDKGVLNLSEVLK